jgi:prolyl-tRNA editing enzyme YbaK/EbsC (Cys-tRNA(Pro) deacylase)
MRISRPIAVTILAATALACGLGGALLLGPASADTSTSTAATTAFGGAGAVAAPCREGLADVAEAIGIATDDLRAALRDGQTLAEVAEANGVDPEQVVDVLVANGTERLDAAVSAGRIDQAAANERRANLPERVAELVNGELERDHRHPRRSVALRTAAEAIGIDAGDLRAALREGQTIAQVAQAHGVEPQDVIDALVARSTERIAKVVNGDTAWQRC